MLTPKSSPLWLSLCSALALLSSATGACAGEWVVPLKGHAGVVVDVPPQWQSQVVNATGGGLPSLKVWSTASPAVELVLTPAEVAMGKDGVGSREVHKAVQDAAARLSGQVVEATLPLKELMATGRPGYYFTATRKQADAHGYRYRTEGVVGMNDLVMGFVVSASTTDDAVVDQALELVRSLRRDKSTAPR